MKNLSLSAIALMLIAISCNKEQQETALASGPPEENRFTTTVLTKPGELDEPMVIDFLPGNKVLWVERKGALKRYDGATGEVKKITTIPVNMKYTSKEGEVREAEEGLMGLAIHPDYEKNHWIYMYYADPDKAQHVLARWELHGDSLYENTKKVVLEVPTQRETCCHTGGGTTWDAEGNLYLTVGNNTGNPVAGTSGLDERPGRSSWDDQRGSGNTNDLRGKILRIHPEDDGTYKIPKGNLFPEGTEKTRPEIYTMGHRNPWRVSLDTKTNYIYWGEVGPDASKDSIIGPRGYDEFNQAKAPGFFGWPYFVADNKPYSHFNYETNDPGPLFDPANPVNESPNNTGLNKLPPPVKAFIFYPYSTSEEFPLVGSSGRSATGGPVFRAADFEGAARPFPSYFEGKWLITEFMRGWIMAVTMDANGDYQSMERILSNENFSSAIDMKFAPDGDLYVLEYGSAWFRGNDNAQIVRIQYNGGNRTPVIKTSADQLAAALPMTVKLSSEGTMDYDSYDKDKLKYEWTVTSDNGYNQTFTEANPTVTLDKAGAYSVTLTVTDTKGASNKQSLELKAGNEPPVANIELTSGNKTFFFAKNPVEYKIDVSDKEDGSLADKKISADEVSVNFDYAPEGFDLIEIASTRASTDEWTEFNSGLRLINNSDCRSCHMNDKKSVGPAYLDVAAKYKNDPAAPEKLANKIIQGGGGVWGDHAMAAHPSISQQNAATMVSYILGLNNKKPAAKKPALAGTFTPVVPAGDNGRGGYLLRVAYKDKGTEHLGSLTSEKIIALRNPSLDPERADIQKGTVLMTTPSRSFSMVGNGSHLGYKNIDLSGIKQIEFLVQAQPRTGATGGVIEVHLDSPDGPLLGQTDQIVPKDVDFRSLTGGNNNNRQRRRPGGGGGAAGFDFSAMRRLMSINVKAPITATEGMHDVYFVFRNPAAKDNQTIVAAVEITFQNAILPQ
ncbi:MAG TPA: PQQ-dependent sugar dehydrogenase [Cyclobacteriaceae bacterium]|nr:PQQ-dependent sugar dehydrogenase [Cyclobacteriaceae bacterium]